MTFGACGHRSRFRSATTARRDASAASRVYFQSIRRVVRFYIVVDLLLIHCSHFVHISSVSALLLRVDITLVCKVPIVHLSIRSSRW